MIGSYFSWQFIEAPKKILFVFRKTITYLYHLFSISFLMRTLFLPWKKDVTEVANPSIQDRLNMFVTNLISIFMGILVRMLTIFAGLITIILSVIFFVILFVAWFVLPFLAVYMIYKGLVV